MYIVITEAILVISILVCVGGNVQKFPDDFLFGTASSSYQIEGAWNENGKGVNIWDTFTHKNSENIFDKSSGDVACDSYHKIKEDVEMLKDLGVQFYRFSLSWSRILPTGFIDKINPDGIRYYNELIDELIKYDIDPMITLYHWDLPQPLQDCGGWPNPLIADYFGDFARVAFEHFGDRVKTWITLNEPFHICQTGYGNGAFAPGIKMDGYATYMCSYTALLAHAKAYHIYDDDFRSIQKGKIGITLDAVWFEPHTNSTEDKYTAELAFQMNFGWYAHPIFSKTGDFPSIFKQTILNRSLAQNMKRSRLPEFTSKQIDFIRGTSDFLGLNHYLSAIVSVPRNASDIIATPAFNLIDFPMTITQPREWESTPTAWIKITPWALRKLLNWIKINFNNPEVLITENGVGDTRAILNDEYRVHYITNYLRELRNAILIDRCNVTAYTLWSIMDNFEWNSGYTLHFGIYHVNFSDPQRTRIPRASAKYYKKVIETRQVEHPFETVD